eukprot:g5268.t1
MKKHERNHKSGKGSLPVRKKRVLFRPKPFKNNRRAKPSERTQQAIRFYQDKVCPTETLTCFTHVKRFVAKFLQANAEDCAVAGAAAGEEDDQSQTNARADFFYHGLGLLDDESELLSKGRKAVADKSKELLSPDGSDARKRKTVRLKEAAVLQLLQSSEDFLQKLASASKTITYARKNLTLQMPDVVAAKAILTSQNLAAVKNTKTGKMALVMPGGRGRANATGRAGEKNSVNAKLDPCAVWDSGNKRSEAHPSCSGLVVTPDLKQAKTPTDNDLRRVTQRAGVLRLGGQPCLRRLRSEWKEYFAVLLYKADLLRQHSAKKTLLKKHVLEAAKKM